MKRLTPSTALVRSRIARGSVRRWVIERAVADARPPQVDRLAQHVDRPGEHVCRQGDRDVLVEDALGPAEAWWVPEGAAEELVPRRAVVEQRGVLRDVGAQPGRGEGAGDHAGLAGAGGREAVVVAGGEVRAGLPRASRRAARRRCGRRRRRCRRRRGSHRSPGRRRCCGRCPGRRWAAGRAGTGRRARRRLPRRRRWSRSRRRRRGSTSRSMNVCWANDSRQSVR